MKFKCFSLVQDFGDKKGMLYCLFQVHFAKFTGIANAWAWYFKKNI